MSKKCKKCGFPCITKTCEICKSREIRELKIDKDELVLRLESVAESLNDAIDFTGSMVSKEKLDKWKKERDVAWNLLRRLEQ